MSADTELHTALKAIEEIILDPSESFANDLLGDIASGDLDDRTKLLLANIVQAVVTAAIDGMPAFREDPDLFDDDDEPLGADDGVGVIHRCAGCETAANLVEVRNCTEHTSTWLCHSCIAARPFPKRPRRRPRD